MWPSLSACEYLAHSAGALSQCSLNRHLLDESVRSPSVGVMEQAPAVRTDWVDSFPVFRDVSFWREDYELLLSWMVDMADRLSISRWNDFLAIVYDVWAKRIANLGDSTCCGLYPAGSRGTSTSSTRRSLEAAVTELEQEKNIRKLEVALKKEATAHAISFKVEQRL